MYRTGADRQRVRSADRGVNNVPCQHISSRNTHELQQRWLSVYHQAWPKSAGDAHRTGRSREWNVRSERPNLANSNRKEARDAGKRIGRNP
jgi:hypothetical protein